MHPEIINRTPLALSLLYLGAEPDGALHAVALAQGTWRIGTDGKLGLIELQHEAPAAGQWYGDPATTSLRLEPQTATAKPSTDVVLLGDAVALGGKPVTQLDLSLSIALATGAVGKRALVIGDRSLSVGLGGSSISPPRAVLTRKLVGFMRARSPAVIKPRVRLLRMTWMVTISAVANSSSLVA